MRPPFPPRLAGLALAAACAAPRTAPTPAVLAVSPPGVSPLASPPLRAGAGSLEARVDAVASGVFASSPEGLEQCVGGVAVVVTPEDELVAGWGATTLGGAVVPDGDTLFQIGSLTKVFTGVAMARLVEEGSFGPDTSAGDLLAADLRDATTSWPTMGALITHHGGLPTYPSNLVDRDGDGARDPDIDSRSPAAGYDRADLRAELASWSPPPSPPYVYSNLGLGLAGLALQDHLGLAGHDETLRLLVTGELGMVDTWGEVAAVPDTARPRFASGHTSGGAAWTVGVQSEMGVLASAGEIVTSGEDMRRLLRALVGLAPSALDDAIARATAPLADGPSGRDMGYAVEIEETADGVRYRKGGSTSSYAAHLVWSTAPPVGVAVLTNCGSFTTVATLAAAIHDTAAAP